MSDSITISKLKVQARIGVSEEERSRPQTLLVDLQLTLDLRPAGISDELGDTIDYDVLTTEIADLVRSSEAKLLEHLAESVATHVCALPSVQGVTVEVAKESPPVTEEVGPIAVRITRP